MIRVAALLACMLLCGCQSGGSPKEFTVHYKFYRTDTGFVCTAKSPIGKTSMEFNLKQIYHTSNDLTTNNATLSCRSGGAR